MADETERLRRSWIANANAWTGAVREQRIESRRLGTDAAIVQAVLDQNPGTVLDLGCGEGWLSRALSSRGLAVTGVDASPDLIGAAQELGGGKFFAMSYEKLRFETPFDVVVANFALLAEDLASPLRAAASVLAPTGKILIQTVHPTIAAGEQGYIDGWRVETFATMGGIWPESMPYYFRTIESWVAALRSNGFTIVEMREPLHPERRQPLSMIFVCGVESR